MTALPEKGITITETKIRETTEITETTETTEIHIIEMIKADTTTIETARASDRIKTQSMTETINNLTRMVDLTPAKSDLTLKTQKEIINLIREGTENMEWRGAEIAKTTRKSIKIDRSMIRTQKDIKEDIIRVIDHPSRSTIKKLHLEINQIMKIKGISDFLKGSNLPNKIEIARAI